jgi:hypothetical protein
VSLAAIVATALLGVVPPPAGARFSYQIGGAYRPPAGVVIVDRDRSDPPAAGAYGICYVNAFQAQPEERGWWLAHHRSLLLWKGRRPVIDTGWNEQLLDTSTPGRRSALAAIVGGWMAGCARAGYRAVEPDNLDSWSRSQGRLTRADNVAFAKLLIARAHSLGLAIGQKNTAELRDQGRRMGFDFAVAEECQVYSECDAFTHAYGREVIEIEYAAAPFRAACRARGRAISMQLRDRDVTPAGGRGYVERFC